MAVLTVLSVLGATGYAKEAPPQQPDRSGPPDGLRPGDVITDRGVGAVVPAPGGFVEAEAMYPDGTTEALSIQTLPDGSVVVSDWGQDEPDEESLPSDGSVLTDAGCSQNQYNFTGKKWYSRYNWYYKTTSTPANMTALTAESALKSSVSAVPNAKNDCGLADVVTATQTYQGSTPSGTDIGINSAGENVCGASDGKSVVAFGPTGGTALGLHCGWASNTGKTYLEATASDVKLSTNYSWRTGAASLTCSTQTPNHWGVESVMTHEAGHIFGLDHVREDLYGALTMSRYAESPCDDTQMTLGLGDYNGLKALYP